jgi:hypothetical protein
VLLVETDLHRWSQALIDAGLLPASSCDDRAAIGRATSEAIELWMRLETGFVQKAFRRP